MHPTKNKRFSELQIVLSAYYGAIITTLAESLKKVTVIRNKIGDNCDRTDISTPTPSRTFYNARIG